MYASSKKASKLDSDEDSYGSEEEDDDVNIEPPSDKSLPVPSKYRALHGGPIQPDGASPSKAPAKESGGLSTHALTVEVGSLPNPEGKGSQMDEKSSQGRSRASSSTHNRSMRSIRSLANQHWARSIKTSDSASEVPTEMSTMTRESSGFNSSPYQVAEQKNSGRIPSTPPAFSPTSGFKDVPVDIGLSLDIHDLGISDAKLDSKDNGLSLNVGLIEEENAELNEESYRISESGTMLIDGFEIRASGLQINSKQSMARSSKPSSGVDAQSNFVQLTILGRGASGVVHKALHVPTLTLVAQKIIPMYDEEKRRQMARELRALYTNLVSLKARQDSPEIASPCKHIVAFYDTFVDPLEGNISIVVEYMDGGSLQDIVDTGGCENESVLANISYQVLKGLEFLHERKQMHRDIKPANLLINHHGHVKVSDFGIVRDLENSSAQVDTFTGTYFYMSPERIMGQEYSYNSDVWSFGLTIMTCALGKFPYSEDSGYWGLLQELKNKEPPTLPEDEYSEEFRDFVSLCLTKDPSKRPKISELLRHPFLKDCSDEPAPADPKDEEEGSDTARSELDDVAGVVKGYYTKLWKQQAKGNISPTVPNFHSSKLRGLSIQLGLPVEVIKRKFSNILAELKQELHTLYSPLTHSDKYEATEKG